MKLALHFSADYLDLRRWLIVVDVFVRSRGQRDWLEGCFRATNVSPVGQQSSGKGRLGRRDRILFVIGECQSRVLSFVDG
jgi:hypothetical protein